MPVSIYEGEKTVSGGDGIEVTENKVINLILRELNNLIKINSNNEVYVDLQLDDNLQSTATIPVGVNVGRVLQANGFPVTGTLITAKTTSGDTVKVLYGDDGEIRVDNGSGIWKILAYEYEAGEGISIDGEMVNDYSAMRGPCDEGFHVPSSQEWSSMIIAANRLGGRIFLTNLKLPSNDPAIYFQNSNQGFEFAYWCRNSSGNGQSHMLTNGEEGSAYNTYGTYRSIGAGVRAFKDEPVIPDETWTLLDAGGSKSVYWNEGLGLISATSDGGTTWMTIQDKNVGAENVGDVGLYFQWGNNKGFTSASAATSSQKVDASGYAPSTYYADPINTAYDWSSVSNNNLWGGVTGVRTYTQNVITNTGVLSVNGQTGHVNIESGGLGFATIMYDDDLDKMCLKQGELADDTVCYFLNMISSPLGIVYSSDGTEELGEIEEAVPSPGSISFKSDTTGLLKIMNGHMIFFPRITVGGK